MTRKRAPGGGRKPEYSREDVKRILELRAQGLSIRKIHAVVVTVSKTTVGRIVKEAL